MMKVSRGQASHAQAVEAELMAIWRLHTKRAGGQGATRAWGTAAHKEAGNSGGVSENEQAKLLVATQAWD